MKIRICKDECDQDIEPYLMPVEHYCQEKIRKGIYDDWNESEHTKNWIQEILSSIKAGGNEQLTIYYLEENGNIIGSVFVLFNSDQLFDHLKSHGILPNCRQIAHLACFHIIEQHRGKGLGTSWLKDEILNDLREQGIKQIYIKSSHHQALPLYEKLGRKIGNYISVSDHALYQRYGYIYRIDL